MLSQRDLDIIHKFADAGQWESFLLAFGNHSNGEGLDRWGAFEIFFDKIPDDKKHEMTMLVYTSCEGIGQYMNKYLQAIKKLRPADLLEPIREHIDEKGFLTIYRGGVEVANPTLQKSWTVSKDIAEWFAKRYGFMGDSIVYRGIIKESNVIAYTNDRQEQEIIQYRNVKNVEIVERFYKADWKTPE